MGDRPPLSLALFGSIAFPLDQDDFRRDFWIIFESLLRDVRGPLGVDAEEGRFGAVRFWATPRGFDGPYAVLSIDGAYGRQVTPRLYRWDPDIRQTLVSHYLKFGVPSLPARLREVAGDQALTTIRALVFEYRNDPDHVDRVKVIPWKGERKVRLPSIQQEALARRIDSDPVAMFLREIGRVRTPRLLRASGEEYGLLETNLLTFNDVLLRAREAAHSSDSLALFRVDQDDLFFIFDHGPGQEQEKVIFVGHLLTVEHKSAERTFDSASFSLRALMIAMEPMNRLPEASGKEIDIIVNANPGNWTIIHGAREYSLAVTDNSL